MPRTSKVRGDFFCSELEEVQADILCEAAADLAVYEVYDQLAGGADDGGVKVSRVALFVRGAADDGVQVEVGRAVLAGERTGCLLYTSSPISHPRKREAGNAGLSAQVDGGM